MKTYAFVFARGGSKGVPGKNIRELAGKPLLAYSLKLAHELDAVEKVFVSTDDEAIADVARRYGAQVIERPSELAQDDSAEWRAWQHAVKWVKEHDDSFEVFLSLPTTAPLRNAHDVNQCLEKLEDGFDCVVTMTNTSRSPWFNMVKSNAEGELTLLVQGGGRIARRQDAPEAYAMSTVAYVVRPDFVLKHRGIWDGLVGGVLIPAERALDIDTELDLELAEFFMQRWSVTGKHNGHAE
jgi:N,N'-diacetyl-8-epilegionaminate cytidylyltransferase